MSPLTIRDCFELINSGIRVNWRGKLVTPEGSVDSHGYLIREAVTAAEDSQSMASATEVSNMSSDDMRVTAVAGPFVDDSVSVPLLGAHGQD